MRWTNLSMTAAMATAVLVLLPVGSAVPAVITGGALEGAGCTTPADGSCNLVFRNEQDLAGLDPGELNLTVFQSCPGFPNGPYQRINLPGDPPDDQVEIDYVTLIHNTPNGDVDLDAGEIFTQIGAVLPDGVSVTVSGTFTNMGAEITIDDTSSGADSQILDLGGFDFVLFEKSQGGGGGQRATLVCDINMWYRDVAPPAFTFGLLNFGVDHGVNKITIGWVAGPSGHFSQDFAEDACDFVGTGSGEVGGLQGTPSYLVGSYKSTTETPVSIINVTGCGVDAVDTLPVLTAYCDGGEAAGSSGSPRPNACNPDGETGGLPDVTSSGVTGSASTCFFFSSGTPMSFPC